MTRAEFPRQVRRDAFLRAEGRCELCGCKQALEYHHRVEAYLGGEATLENCVVLCRSCHALATGERRPEIDKVRRIADKRIGIRKKATMPGSRGSRWKKRMDGTVERR